jgi:hypothetical protein
VNFSPAEVFNTLLVLRKIHHQAFPAFGPATLQHFSTRFGAHARPETMRPDSLCPTWLIGPFQGLLLSKTPKPDFLHSL